MTSRPLFAPLNSFAQECTINIDIDGKQLTVSISYEMVLSLQVWCLN